MLSDTLSNLLDRPITEETAHSRTVCEVCLQLCTEFDILFSRLDAIKTHVTQCYNETIENHYCIDIIAQDGVDEMHSLTNEPDQEVSFEEKAISISDDVRDAQQEPSQMQEIIFEGKKLSLIKHPSRPTNLGSTSSSEVSRLIQEMPFQLIEENDDIYLNDGSSIIKNELLDDQETQFGESGNECYDDDFNVIEEAVSETTQEECLEHIENVFKTENCTSQDELDPIQCSTNTEVMISLDPDEPNTFEEVTIKPIFVREGTIFKCQLCEESSTEIFDHRSIVGHMKKTHNERVFVCDLCGADYRQKKELTEHMEKHVSGAIDVNMECDVCLRVFTNLRLFRNHTKSHITIDAKSEKGIASKSWACKFCNKKFTSRMSMEVHKNQHTGDRPYKCADCHKGFASKYTLTAHMKIHSDRKRPYACQTCPKTFYSHQNLVQHERTHTGVKEHVCNICDKAFGTAHNLEVHNIVHTGYKPFVCRTCGKAFARRAEIKDHERTHTGERPFACDICGISFAQRSNLTSHKRATHLNDKRYKCDECGKTFKRRRLLDYHCKASHTGERPYTCHICGSTFVYPEHYKKHLRIHSGVKPFECEVCGKAFNSRDHRNAHRFIHSDKKPYECLFCGMGFMRKPQLLAHMKIYNHENKRIVLNQPRIMAVGEDNTSGKSIIESNVVYIDDCLDNDGDDEPEFEIENVSKPMLNITKIPRN